MLAERLWNLNFCALENADELEGVDDGFALEMIVGDDKGVAGVLGDFTDARGPGNKLLGGVEVVVSLVRRDAGVVGKPGVVAAAVKTNVTDRRSGLSGGLKGAADNGLIDVAKAGVVFAEERERIWGIPSGMTKFDDERIITKTEKDRGEKSYGLLCAVEGERELEEDGAEFVGVAKDVEAGTDGALVGGGDARRGGDSVVRESLPEFGGEDKTGIGGDEVEPVSSVNGAERLVE